MTSSKMLQKNSENYNGKVNKGIQKIITFLLELSS